MAESAIPRTKHDVSLQISDAGAALTYTIGKQPGDFAYTAPGYGTVDILDNGVPAGVRRGDGAPAAFSFSVHLADVGSTTYATMPDICEQRGYWASTAVSTLDGETDEPTADLTATIDGSKFGEADKSLVFEDALFRSGGADFGALASYKVTGRCATAMAPTLV